jgi:hypothetical protein
MGEPNRRDAKDRRRISRGGRRQADQVTVRALQRQLEVLRIELRTLIAEVEQLKERTE